jgi:membrane protease subunit HflC
MAKHGWIIFLLVVVIALLLAYSSAFIVDFKQIAIVQTFGKASEPIDGATQAGLHFKWPWPVQSLARYDSRTHVFEDTSGQIMTKDNQTVIISVYCGWRIKDALKFLRSLKTVKEGEQRLRDLVQERKQRVVTGYSLSSFVNTDKEIMRMDEMEQKILASVMEAADEEYGIEVRSLGFKSLVVAKAVSQKIIKNMESERREKAERYTSLGEAVAGAITSRAEAARKQILAFANTRAQKIYSEGIRDAAKLYPIFRGNERFAVFLRRLEFIRQAFAENTVFLLDPSVERGIGFFKDGASLDPGDGPKPQPTKTPEQP